MVSVYREFTWKSNSQLKAATILSGPREEARTGTDDLQFICVERAKAGDQTSPKKQDNNDSVQFPNIDFKVSKDHHLASSAQIEDNDTEDMSSNFWGVAWDFVQAVLEEHKLLLASESGEGAEAIQMETIGSDDMIFSVERLLEAKKLFKFALKPTFVDIGYHYTRSENLSHIKTNGLLTKAERCQRGVTSNYNGSRYGDGIYTSSNPFAFTKYGDIGVMVARLRGFEAGAKKGSSPLLADTAVVDRDGHNEMLILKRSCQCVPLLKFKRAPLTRDASVEESDRAIWDAHSRLQAIIDKHFHNGRPTAIKLYERCSFRTLQRRADPPTPQLGQVSQTLENAQQPEPSAHRRNSQIPVQRALAPALVPPPPPLVRQTAMVIEPSTFFPGKVRVAAMSSNFRLSCRAN
jgi:hypothetical protein